MHFDPLQTPVRFVLFGVCVWCAVSFIISLCGWHWLALRHAATSRPVGVTFRGASGWIAAFGSYSRCLNVISAPSGIYVETQLMFRLFHRPLFFPWRCVSSLDLPTGFLWRRYVRLTITAGSFKFRLHLPRQAAPELQSHISRHITVA